MTPAAPATNATQARNALFETVWPLVWKLAHKAARPPRLTAAELVGPISAAVLTAIPKHDSTRGAALMTFVYAVAQNAVRDYLRREPLIRASAGPSRPAVVSCDAVANWLIDSREPFAVVEIADEIAAVRRAVAELPESDREIIERRFALDGQPEESQRDIGSRRGVSAARISYCERRAIGKLSKRMNT